MEYKEDKKKERRKKKRFPILKDMDIPISIQIHGQEDIEGILLNLSAIGIGLISFTPIREGTRVKLSLRLDHLEANNLKGRVIWSKNHKNTYRIGIEFIKLDKKLTREIDSIAEDFVDCEIKIMLGVKDICYPECRYYSFCRKKEKV